MSVYVINKRRRNFLFAMNFYFIYHNFHFTHYGKKKNRDFNVRHYFILMSSEVSYQLQGVKFCDALPISWIIDDSDITYNTILKNKSLFLKFVLQNNL